MKELRPLQSTGICIIEVPLNAKDIDIKNNVLFYWQDDNIIPITIYLPSSYELLGPITCDIISFDPAPYLESQKSNVHVATAYKNYTTNGWTWSKEESFRSMLNSCGYYWVNLMVYPKQEDFYISSADSMYDWEALHEAVTKYESFEDNLVSGILLALIKK